MPRLEDLRTFCLVVELKSFSLAARQIGITQPAVSQQIKTLETIYAVRLLDRHGSTTVPTEAGKLVYEIANQIISIFDHSCQRITEMRGEISGTLAIGAGSGPGESLLPILMGEFSKLHPGAQLTLRIGDASSIIEMLLQHRLDLAVVGSAARDRHLTFEPLILDRLILVVHPDDPLAGRSSISLKELPKIPLIVQQHGSGAANALFHSLDAFQIGPSDLNIVMEAGLQESARTAVRNGLGATIISRLGVLNDLSCQKLVEVEIEGVMLNQEFSIAFRSNEQQSALSVDFMAYLKQEVKEAVSRIEGITG